MTIDVYRRTRYRALTFAAILGFAGLALGPRAWASCGEDLHPGVPVTGIASDPACPEGPVFTISVPAGVARLSISTSGGTGNADLLVKFGSPPTSVSFDFSSNGPGNLENVTVDNPQAGTWYVQVRRHEPFSGITLVADISAPETEVHDGEPQTNLQDTHQNDFQYFTIDVPPGTASVSVTTSGGTGNADLLVRFGALPTSTVFDGSSHGTTNNERVDIPSPQGGTLKIAVVATMPYSGLTLVVDIVPGGSCVPAPESACLLSNRFRVEVTFTNQHDNDTKGTGKTLPGTDQTTYFWFFSKENTELVLKMVDGRPLNNHFWVFHGGLSDVDYVIKVTDTVTGVVHTYHNPAGKLTSEADTSAF
ncbi:MAG TPA: PPC domain-containing protein [Thermoanaerobaculia bacterium]|nr:PPC domain-containing protein [Thermoanaerobaculia bacterium]